MSYRSGYLRFSPDVTEDINALATADLVPAKAGLRVVVTAMYLCHVNTTAGYVRFYTGTTSTPLASLRHTLSSPIQMAAPAVFVTEPGEAFGAQKLSGGSMDGFFTWHYAK